MTELNASDLLALPNGAFFIELDIAAFPIFQKVNDCEGDILIRPLFDKPDLENCRLGIREMDACERASKRYYRLNDADRMYVAQRIATLQEPAKSGSVN